MARTETIEMVVLANSERNHARCLAGKDISNNRWIRPVSTHGGGEIPAKETHHDGSAPCSLTDVVEISLTEHRPIDGQPENWFFEPGPFRRIRNFSWDELHQIKDTPASLWNNLSYSSSHHQKKKIPPDRIAQVEQSLYLIHVENAKITLSKRAIFDYAGESYDLAITDIEKMAEFREIAKSESVDEKNIGECFLTLSITATPYRYYHWKLVAGIIQPSDIQGK